MKKMMSVVISTFVLITSFTNSFAAIRVDEVKSPELTTSGKLFSGKIYLASYFPKENNLPTVIIGFRDENNHFIELNFTEADLPVGIVLLNRVGKDIVVYFSDTNFTVESVQVPN